MKKVQLIAAAVAAASCTTTSYANDRLEETVVVSSRIEMPLRQVATSVSVVSKEDIEVRGFAAISDTLRYEPGISVTNSGGVGKQTTVRVRGEGGFRTRTFIDGINISDASTTQAGPNMANLTTTGIERIEVLRGPQGMMYGADAGGVINITTLRPTEGLQGGLSAEYGRYSTSNLEGYLAGGNEQLDFAITGGQFDTDGFNSRTDDTQLRDDDGYENTTLHGRGGWNISSQLRAEIVARHVDGDNDYDFCSAPPDFIRGDDCTNDFEQNAYRTALLHDGDQFSNTLSYNYNKIERVFMKGSTTLFEYEGELEKVEYLGSWRTSDALTFVYGADFQSESADIDEGPGSESDNSRDQDGYYAEVQLSPLENVYLTGGARYDDNDDFGSETTYRASAAYLIGTGGGDIKFKATYGTGFRAPSLYELAYNAGGFAFPPASGTELGAEESTGYDFGVGYYANSGWYVDAVFFSQEIDNEIFFDLETFSGYLQDDGDTTSEGIELSTEFPIIEMLSLRGNYTYNDTEDFDGNQRARVPEHMGNLGLQLTPWDGRLVANLNIRVARDYAENLDDYEVLDLSLSYAVTEQLEVFGRIENLTDEDYEEVAGFNTAGASGFAGVRYSF